MLACVCSVHTTYAEDSLQMWETVAVSRLCYLFTGFNEDEIETKKIEHTKSDIFIYM